MTPARPTKAGPVRRRRRLPGQGRLLGSAAMIIFGALLPWLYTPAGQISGMRGAGLWTFYAAMLALAGGLVPHRTMATVQGAVVGVVALALPIWQVVHTLQLVGVEGWAPGPGLVLTVGGGVLALVAANQLRAGRGTEQPAPAR